MTMLSPHFSYEELTRTRHNFPNDPGQEEAENINRLLFELMEPIREILGNVPVIVHSGYRSQQVNSAVGGAWNSAHLEGRACDFHSKTGKMIRDDFEKILNSDLPYDKLLLEYRDSQHWIHAQIAPYGEEPRRRAFIGAWDEITEKFEWRRVHGKSQNG